MRNRARIASWSLVAVALAGYGIYRGAMVLSDWRNGSMLWNGTFGVSIYDDVEIEFNDGKQSYKRSLDGESEHFCRVWRALKFSPNSTLCHDPGFFATFRDEGNVHFTASICLRCQNIQINYPSWDRCLNIEGTEELVAMLHARFPEFIEAETK